jgi:hypothetical protein
MLRDRFSSQWLVYGHQALNFWLASETITCYGRYSMEAIMMDFDQLMLLGAFGSGALTAGCIVYNHLTKKWEKKEREADRRGELRVYIRLEEKRQATLPSINRALFLPYRSTDSSAELRSFRVRDEYVYVLESDHTGWVGFAIPEVLESLRDGEYVDDMRLQVPIAGPGQNHAGKSLVVDGYTIPVYPRHFKDFRVDNQGRIPDPQKFSQVRHWVSLGKAFQEAYGAKGESFFDSYRKLFPQSALNEAITRRRHLDHMRLEYESLGGK